MNPCRAIALGSAAFALAACGASADGATEPIDVPADAPATVPSVATAPATTEPSTPTPAPTTDGAAAPDGAVTTPTVLDQVPLRRIDAPAGECPLGTWSIDAASLTLFGDLGAFEGMDVEFDGRFIVRFASDAYAISSDDFSISVVGAAMTLDIEVFGSTWGDLTIGAGEMTLSEVDYELDAEVLVNGEPDAEQFIIDGFHQTFGSQLVPFTCDGESLTVTYSTPTGSATAVHQRIP